MGKIKLQKKDLLITWLPLLIAALLLGFVAWRNLSPNGSLTFTSDLQSFTPFVSILTPEERTEISDEGVVVTSEPVYFDVHIPRHFDTLELDLEYINDSIPVVEIGKDVGSQEVFAFDLQPLENKVLDSLGWDIVEDEGLRLYQREKNTADSGWP